jgi:hypothetical protein
MTVDSPWWARVALAGVGWYVWFREARRVFRRGRGGGASSSTRMLERIGVLCWPAGVVCILLLFPATSAHAPLWVLAVMLVLAGAFVLGGVLIAVASILRRPPDN